MLESLSLLNLVLSVCVIVGGYIAVRQGFSATAGEAQERAINALESEIQALHSRIDGLEQENTRLDQTITTICAALKQRGIHITVDGNIVCIHDPVEGSYSYSTRIYGVDGGGSDKPGESGGGRSGMGSYQRGRGGKSHFSHTHEAENGEGWGY